MNASHADYDNVHINTHPNAMKHAAEELAVLAKDVGHSMESIEKTLEALSLSWSGKASQERKRITNEWQQAFQELFGSRHHPEDGLLNIITVGVGQAAMNFAKVDMAVTHLFRQFANAGGGSPSYTDQTTNTAVTADYPD